MNKTLNIILSALIFFAAITTNNISAHAAQAPVIAAQPVAVQTTTDATVEATPLPAIKAPTSVTNNLTVPLFLDGTQIITTTPAQNIKGTTMVPLRVISEKLNAVVIWSDADKSITVTNGSTKIVMQMDNLSVTVNNNVEQLPMAPVNIGNLTLLPLRFLANQLNLSIAWNNQNNSVYLLQNRDKDIVNSETVNSDGNGIAEIQSIQRFADQVVITGDGNLNPFVTTLDSPDRISFDFTNSELSQALNQAKNKQISDSGTSALSTSTVTSSVYAQNVRYSLFAINPSTVRVVVDLKQKSGYELIPNNQDHQLTIQLTSLIANSDPTTDTASTTTPASVDTANADTANAGNANADANNNITAISASPTPAPTAIPKPYTIVLDAGHGGKDPGAPSITGKLEKTFTLEMVQKITALLQNDPLVHVVNTRSDDTFVSLDDRVKVANDLQASLFISIHANTYGKQSKGVETYYYRDPSLAKVLQPLLVAATGFVDGQIRDNDYRVIKYTNMPAVLCEIGYLSNPIEEKLLYTDSFQENVAEAIVNGIKQYLNIT